MLQTPTITPTHPFSHEILIEAYQKLDFTKTSQTLELFLAIDSPLPKETLPMIHPCSLTEPSKSPLFCPICLVTILINMLMKLS